MRKLAFTLVAAGIVALGAVTPASAQEINADVFETFLREFGAPPVDGIAHPVDEVYSSDPFSGAPSTAFAEAQPLDWGSFQLTRISPDLRRQLLQESIRQFEESLGPSVAATPEFNADAAGDIQILYVRTKGDVSGAEGFGVNFGFDTDPNVDGRRADGTPTPGDCAIDAFVGGGQESLQTSTVTQNGGDFTPTPAPFLRILHRDGMIFIVPGGHPCLGAQGIAPATYGIVGQQAVEHAVVRPGRPFLRFEDVFFDLVPARGTTGGTAAPTSTTAAATSDDGGGGSNRTLVGGGILIGGAVALGTGIALAFRARRGGGETPAPPRPAPEPEGMTPKDKEKLGDAILGALGETTIEEDVDKWFDSHTQPQPEDADEGTVLDDIKGQEPPVIS